MSAQAKVNARYADLCKKLGDIQFRIELMNREKRLILEQMETLNDAMPLAAEIDKGLADGDERSASPQHP